jgi:hypothetical protein
MKPLRNQGFFAVLALCQTVWQRLATLSNEAEFIQILSRELSNNFKRFESNLIASAT